MKGNEDACFGIVMREEGGAEISRIRSDPGNWSKGKIGAGTLMSTQWGVSAPVALDLGLTPGSITRDQARNRVFLPRYWAPMGCDADPKGVDLVKIDMAYNGGVGAAQKLEAKTRKTARTADQFISTYSANRLALFKTFATWRTFGPRNWGPRIARVEADAHRMNKTPAALVSAHAEEAQAASTRSMSTAAVVVPSAAVPATAAPAIPVTDMTSVYILIGLIVFAGIAAVAVLIWRAKGHAARAETLQALATEIQHG